MQMKLCDEEPAFLGKITHSVKSMVEIYMLGQKSKPGRYLVS